MKPIPFHILNEAEAHASIPVKSPKDYTAAIYHAVAHIKAAKRTKADASPAWERLKSILDDAVQENQLGAFDDMAKAWENLEVETLTFTITEGNTVTTLTHGEITKRPRQPITVAVIQAIRNLQWRKDHAPTRQEILDETARMNEPIDETELCRQLGKLGWQKMIPESRKKTS